MLTIFAGLVEFERTCMLERQKEGISIAKKQGKFKGRKHKIYDNEIFKNCINAIDNKKMKVSEAMELLGIKSRKVYYERRQAFLKFGNCNTVI